MSFFARGPIYTSRPPEPREPSYAERLARAEEAIAEHAARIEVLQDALSAVEAKLAHVEGD